MVRENHLRVGFSSSNYFVMVQQTIPWGSRKPSQKAEEQEMLSIIDGKKLRFKYNVFFKTGYKSMKELTS